MDPTEALDELAEAGKTHNWKPNVVLLDEEKDKVMAFEAFGKKPDKLPAVLAKIMLPQVLPLEIVEPEWQEVQLPSPGALVKPALGPDW